jgi:outer membrane protein, heavy metal efflux system
MSIRLSGAAGVALVLVTRLSAAQTPLPPEPLTLEAAFARALAANPTLVAARLTRDVAIAGVALARERPNPEARVEFERETPTRAYGVGMPIELGGKRGRRIAVSEAVVQTSEAQRARTIVEIRAEVRRAYFEGVIATARLALFEELLSLAGRGRDAAEERFNAGSAPRLEVLQARLALAQAENETTAARATVTGARVRLNALLGFPLDAAVTLSTPLAPASVPVDVAIARAQNSNAELAVLARRLAEQSARVAFARAMQVPDLAPEGTITRGAEPEFATGWRAAVAVAVPIFTRHRAGVRVEEATLTQLTAQRAAVAARVIGEVASTAAVVEGQSQLYVRYRDAILPQALEVEHMAEDAYRLGQSGIAALLQALQASRDARLRALQAASDLQNTLVDLERAMGAPLP